MVGRRQLVELADITVEIFVTPVIVLLFPLLSIMVALF